MDKKPRIAFCFSGQARTLAQTYQLFQKNLFEAAEEQGFDYDVFCAVEDDEDVDKVNLLNPTKIEKIKSNEVKEIIEEKWGYFIKYEYAEKYGYCGRGSSINVLQQFYKICQSIKLKNQYKSEKNISYDIVFKLRFDTPFARKLNFNNILKALQGKDKIVLCNRNKMLRSAKFIIKIEDFYFIMNDETSNILGDIFENWNICFKGCELKHKKLNKNFEKIRNNLYKNLPFLHTIFPIVGPYIYSICFHFFSAETYAINYFENNKCEINTDEYITVWIIRDSKKYKRFDFRTYTKMQLFSKGLYEL